MMLGNESNNDYIAPIIKIEECRASELTIWGAAGLAAGVLSRELLHGKDSHGEEASFSLGITPFLPSHGSPCYFTRERLLMTTSPHASVLAQSWDCLQSL